MSKRKSKSNRNSNSDSSGGSSSSGSGSSGSSSNRCNNSRSNNHNSSGIVGVKLFVMPIFVLLVPVFVFWRGGWCKLWQEKRRIADVLTVLQRNTPFRAQGLATQHSFYGLGCCNPTLLLGLRALQRNTPFRAQGLATQHSF